MSFSIITDTKEFQKDANGQIVRSARSAKYFVTLVKFDPGVGPEKFMNYFDEADKKLAKKKMQTRAQRGIHEDLTFITMGRYDLVILWHAPDSNTAHEYMNDLVQYAPADGASTETLSASGEVGT